MDTRQGTLHDVVASLRNAGTDLFEVEAKSAVGKVPKSLWPTVSAFSNRGGGLIILGLDEDAGFSPAKGFDPVSIRDTLTHCFRPRTSHEGDGPVTPQPRGTVDIAEVDNAPVVVVEVDELPSEQKPAFVTPQGKERGTYERIGDADVRMSTYGVFLLSTEGVQPDHDSQPVEGATLENLENGQVNRFIARLRRRRPRSVEDLNSTEDILRRHGVLAADSVTPTFAGLLTLGRYPQEFFRQAMVTFAVYPGASKATVIDHTRMLDSRVLEGPIPVMVEDTVTAVSQNMRHRRVARGAGASDEPEVPLEAIREAVANALAHRDYSQWALGEQVRVEMFPDRIEISNPGGIWGGRSVVDLYDGSSRSRNKTLTALLTDVLLPDRDEAVSENAGSGIPRMAGILGRAGLATPKFIDETTQLRTVLDRHGLLTPEMQDWLRSIGAQLLDPDLQRGLALVRQGHEIDAQVLRAQLAIDTEEARELLRRLTDDGWLRYPRAAGESYHSGKRLDLQGDRRGQPLLDLPPIPTNSEESRDSMILSEVAKSGEVGIQRLAEELGSTANALRPRLRVLVEQGALLPTAPPQSKRRKYRIPTGNSH